ncbi:hypothetical protein [Devosia sp. 2618]|uniref:hypothetical protein n=1 Tax=Devosia sp. 2618 TaxID=3156454 RepID=UPI003393C447
MTFPTLPITPNAERKAMVDGLRDVGETLPIRIACNFNFGTRFIIGPGANLDAGRIAARITKPAA